ncbi:hypothetical protein NDU88_004838 [Pleurodeles waltl]|uniref:Reverse transcriptase domain-containing protein n=1 Tax=Pleurodeles waltl TaxID=8319 RepID=A0AAV7MHQ2_PLEWA|nr:hypothetical protein NDU88_004838 [Pleurodeles waltl]
MIGHLYKKGFVPCQQLHELTNQLILAIDLASENLDPLVIVTIDVAKAFDRDAMNSQSKKVIGGGRDGLLAPKEKLKKMRKRKHEVSEAAKVSVPHNPPPGRPSRSDMPRWAEVSMSINSFFAKCY